MARITETTPVHVVVPDLHIESCRRALANQTIDGRQVHLHAVATNDVWIRDYGPFFVHDHVGRVAAVNFGFNSWGEKYPPWRDDDLAGERIAELAGVGVVNLPLHLEGGALEGDGRGRLLTTPQCVLGESRHRDRPTPKRRRGPMAFSTPKRFDQQAAGRMLYRFLGVEETVWIDDCFLEGDDTDGHIDQIARFVSPSDLVVATGDPTRSEHRLLRSVRSQLELWAENTRPKIRVHPLPLPPHRRHHDQVLPQSYCNFQWLGPDRLLMPGFDAVADQRAAEILSSASGAEVEVVDSRDLVMGLGSLHCASLEQFSPREPIGS